MEALFVELPAFSRYRHDYLDDEAFRSLQFVLMLNPQAGSVIQGTGALRNASRSDRCSIWKSKRGLKMKRDVFSELSEGFDALAQARQGKLTLRSHKVQLAELMAVSAEELVAIRERLNMSRAVFAMYLRTNARTLENWEQGRARPNARAVTLIRLVEKFPETVEHLAALA